MKKENINILKFKDFRTETDDYFKLSGIRETRRLSHKPFIVFDNALWSAEAVKKIKEIEEHEDIWEKDIPDLYKTMISKKEELLKQLKENITVITIVDNIWDLMKFPPYTDVISQWKGEYRSDYFHFKVIDLSEYIKNNPKESYHVA